MDTFAPIQQTPPSKLSTILLVISALGLFATTVLLAFQNTQLQSQISSLESKINSKPTISPTPTQKLPIGADMFAGWKDYQNSDFGISLKYPEEYKLTEAGPAGDYLYMISLSNEDKTNPVFFGLSVYEVHPTKFTLESYTKLFHDPNPIGNPPIQKDEFSKITQTEIGGLKANTFTSNLCQSKGQKCTRYLSSNGKYVFFISTLANSDDVFTDQILVNLKFTEDKTNWKTYSTKGLGFRYPSNLTIKNVGNGVVSFVGQGSNQKFSLNGFKTLTSKEYLEYVAQRKSSNNLQNQETYVDSKQRTWQTDMGLGEVYNFTAVLSQKDRYFVLSLQSGFGEESDGGKTFRNFAKQILSTVEFTK